MQPYLTRFAVFAWLLLLAAKTATQSASLDIAQPQETVTPEIPIKVSASLVDNLGEPIYGQQLIFQRLDSETGLWTNLDDKLTTTSSVTRTGSGTADVFFVPGRTESASVRVTLPGSATQPAISDTIRYDLIPTPSAFQDLRELTHTKGEGIPLILVHGRSGEGDFRRWDTYLDYVRTYPDPFAEFDVYVWDHDTRKPVGFNGTTGSTQDLYESLENIAPSYSNFTPMFLAHSRGGLVVRSLMNRVEPDGSLYGDRILGVVTLGTPHHGSPLAVTDWGSAIWDQATRDAPAASVVYPLLMGERGLLFETDMIGDLNLAWDNFDGAIPTSGLGQTPQGEVLLSVADANRPDQAESDGTVYYSPLWKDRFGTLSELNAEMPFKQKIVTVGAYRTETSGLLVNIISGIQIILSFPFSQDLRDWFDIQLLDGDRDHNLLNIGNRLLAHTMSDLFENASDINFDANDGLVPLQSALFLSASDNIANSSPERRVRISPDLISLARQVKAHHIFTTADGIENHLDLLTTTNTDFWNTITQELRHFLPRASGQACAQDLDRNLVIDFADFLMFAERFSAQDPSIDFNVDSATDFNDFLLFAARYGQSCP